MSAWRSFSSTTLDLIMDNAESYTLYRALKRLDVACHYKVSVRGIGTLASRVPESKPQTRTTP